MRQNPGRTNRSGVGNPFGEPLTLKLSLNSTSLLPHCRLVSWIHSPDLAPPTPLLYRGFPDTQRFLHERTNPTFLCIVVSLIHRGSYTSGRTRLSSVSWFPDTQTSAHLPTPRQLVVRQLPKIPTSTLAKHGVKCCQLSGGRSAHDRTNSDRRGPSSMRKQSYSKCSKSPYCF